MGTISIYEIEGEFFKSIKHFERSGHPVHARQCELFARDLASRYGTATPKGARWVARADRWKKIAEDIAASQALDLTAQEAAKSP